MFGGISIVCFAASYLVALSLEVTRFFFRAGLRMFTIVIFAIAGLLAHTIYLTFQAQAGLATRGAPLSSWYHWCLLAAWLLAIVYIALTLTRPRNTLGLFLLPLILLLIGAAHFFPRDQSFPVQSANAVWSMIHGLSLLIGTATVFFGFAAGVMYLIQSQRLKKRVPPARQGLSLPSLEWLERASEQSLIASSLTLVAGVVSGIVLNLIKHTNQSGTLRWTDPVVWTSAVLMIWFITILVFTAVYKPARHGRKVAYLTLASFLFLLCVLGIALFGRTDHAVSYGPSGGPGRSTCCAAASQWRCQV